MPAVAPQILRFAVRDVVHLDGQSAQLAPAGFVIGGVQDEVERHFEHIVNFGLGDPQLIVRVDEADHRRHPKTGDDVMIRQVPGEFHVIRQQPDLLVGLAQRRMPGILVLGLDAAAGKADLAGVILERFGTLGQQHRQSGVALHQRNEHGRGDAARRYRGAHLGHHFGRRAGQPLHVLLRRGGLRVQRLADVRLCVERIHRHEAEPEPGCRLRSAS